VRAGVSSNSYLAAVSPHIKAWETFKLIDLGDGNVALQSVHNGKYVRAGVGAESYLAAVSPHVKAWETFSLMTGKMIADDYAKIAVAQNNQNLSSKLGLIGPRWSSNYNHHYNWALKTPSDGRVIVAETIRRIKELRGKGVAVPVGVVPIDIVVNSIHCIEETDEAGSDEPYILAFAIDQGPNLVNITGVPIPIDLSLLAPNVEATLYGPWDPVWVGETHRTSKSDKPFWGPDHKPKLAAHPDDPILIVSLMENDDGEPGVARSISKSTAVGTLAASAQMSRASRVDKLIKDIHDVLGTPTGAPNFDERIGTKELRLGFEDLLPPWFGNSQKSLFFEGDGGRYKVIFEVRKAKS
jgi:hypothetical protein